MDTTGDFVIGDSASYIKFDVSAGTVAVKADTIQLGSTDVSTFDGDYGNLSNAPDVIETITAPDGTVFSPSATNVSLTRNSLNITSAYLDGLGAVVMGTTDITGGRIQLTSSGSMDFDTTSSTNTLSSGGIDINAHTQQIIISDSS